MSSPRIDRRESLESSDEMEVLRRTLAYARDHDYTGWDYGDGMSSQVLELVPFESKWLNLGVQETIKRAPINIRPLLRVEQRRNFKGAALFAMANLNTSRLTPNEEYQKEAAGLVEWLVENQSDWYPEFCGCHRHDLQGLDKKTEAGTPGVVGTAYGVQALLLAADIIDARYADVARTAADFVFDRLGYEEFDGGAHIDYRPTSSGEYHTLNANALGARILLDLYDHGNDPRLRDAATKILDYVVSKQVAGKGWMYRDPPEASHLSMDNHHNGFIIETLLRYEDVVATGRYDRTLDGSLSFYREVLFESNGAPNWDESSSYPRDIHAAAQGILVFTYVGDLAFASRIIDWTLENLYAGDGRFYYRKQRFYTKPITLMRWCQAWMAYALSEYLSAHSDDTRRADASHPR